MGDSLAVADRLFSGIPEPGQRVAALFVAAFVIAILILLIYLKMRESDLPGEGGTKGG